MHEKDVQILEENINEGNPEVDIEEVTGNDGEDAFTNQHFSEKRMKQMISALKVLKIVNGPNYQGT